LSLIPRRLAPHIGDAQHVGGAGRAERHAGHHDHALAGLGPKPSLNAMRQARSTMSSWSCASSVTTQCTPHTTASLRPVAMLGDSATIGGRSPPYTILVAIEVRADMSRNGR